MEANAAAAYTWKLGEAGNKPIVAIVIGMAGSGKTTLTQRINAHVHERKWPTYLINLDPAVSRVPYTPNIDIRESLNYKDVMKQYNLGPNGGILTALNLFSTKFDEVMHFVDKRAPSYVMIDTPGQIEVFNWSASGAIVTEAFASSYPTVFVYVVDTPRSAHPQTFMSNMLYACSLFYKARLPLVLAFTKTDIIKHDFAVQWMTDFDAFDDACRGQERYVANFTQSMGLMLGEFYANFPVVGVSAVTGEGMDELFAALQRAACEYETGYKADLEQHKAARAEAEAARQGENMSRLVRDVALDAVSPMNAVGQKIEATRGNGMEVEPHPDEATDAGEMDADERAVYERFMRLMREKE